MDIPSLLSSSVPKALCNGPNNNLTGLGYFTNLILDGTNTVSVGVCSLSNAVLRFVGVILLIPKDALTIPGHYPFKMRT